MFAEYIKFYYRALSGDERAVYKTLYAAYAARENSVLIKVDKTKCDIKRIAYINECVYNDTPAFYFIDMSHYRWSETDEGYKFNIDFCYTIKEINEYDRKIEKGLDIFMQNYISDNMTDYEKELVIHNYLVSKITYDTYAANHDAHPDERIHDAYNIIGALIKKKAVCWGIACAFKLLCDYCKIKCFVVIGGAEQREFDGHAWNMVRIDNSNYHVDVTWDIRKSDDIRCCYDYLNLSDPIIKFNHDWDKTIYPKCNSSKYNYYCINKLYVKKLEDISSFVSRRVKLGNEYIAFKYVGDMPDDESIRVQLRKGVNRTYSYLISRETHNIYVEVKD